MEVQVTCPKNQKATFSILHFDPNVFFHFYCTFFFFLSSCFSLSLIFTLLIPLSRFYLTSILFFYGKILVVAFLFLFFFFLVWSKTCSPFLDILDYVHFNFPSSFLANAVFFLSFWFLTFSWGKPDWVHMFCNV